MLIHTYIDICRYIDVKEILCNSNIFFTNISKIYIHRKKLFIILVSQNH